MTPSTQDAYKKWALRAGLIAGITGAVFSFLLGTIVIGADWEVYTYTLIAFIVTFLVGYLLWNLFTRRARSISIKVGLITGALIGLLPNPIAWSIFSLLDGGNVIEAVEIGFMAAMASFIFGGFLAIPIGAVGGAIIAKTQAKDPAFHTPLPESPTGEDPLPASSA